MQFKIIRLYCSSTLSRPPIKFKFVQDAHKSSKKTIHREKTCINSHLSKNSESFFVSSDLLCTTHNQNLRQKNTLAKSDYIYGIFPILLSLKAQRRSFKTFYYKEDVLKKNDNVKEIYRLCKVYNIPIEPITKKHLLYLVGKENVHQGVCLEATHLPFLVLDDLATLDPIEVASSPRQRKLWLYLDQINDPMNFGAVLRTAHYLGVDKVLTSKHNSCPLTNVVSKASSGAAEILPVFQVPNEIPILKSLQELDWEVIGSSHHKNCVPLHQFQPSKNIVLIVGNEGRGISEELESVIDTMVTIPSHSNPGNSVESLNVSVATSILLYSLIFMCKI